jgi:hypothetical protein
MKLLDPTRSQVTVEREVIIRVRNPTGMFMLADYAPIKATNAQGTRCQVNQGPEVRINCKFSRQGNWRVNLFLNRERYGSFAYAGQIMVNSR